MRCCDEVIYREGGRIERRVDLEKKTERDREKKREKKSKRRNLKKTNLSIYLYLGILR